MKKIILFTFVLSNLFAGQYASEAKNLNSHFSRDFQNTIVNPGTGVNDFKTVDGNSTFSANMTCDGATKAIADISYSGTSDISILINADVNGDGTKEISNTLANISGICADGVVKCDVGTWNNCNYYTYQYNANGIFLSSTNRANSSSCYCINDSCGGLAAHDKERILNDILASVYNILQVQMPRFVLTRINNNSSFVEIYGENQDACVNYQTGDRNYTYNETDATNLTNQGNNEMARQQNNANSAASTLFKAAENENSIDYTIEKNELRAKANLVPAATESNKLVSAAGETFNMTKMEDINEIKYCQVQLTSINAQIYTDGSTAYTSNTANKNIVKYELRECTGNNNDICPIETGEIVKYACGQVNQSSFNESVSGLEGIKEIAKDFTCSMN
ncbi:MAG: hypothetical protein WC667_05095 [Sulfurimonas sp.]|jgi:hypothetical protein